MLFEIFEYLFGEIKMLIYKLIYLGKLKYSIIGKYSNRIQIRIMQKGKLVLIKNNLLRSGVKIRIQNEAVVTIGENTGLNYNCILNAHDKITIGKNTTFGQNVKLYDHDHDYKKAGLLRDSGFTTAPIVIGDNYPITRNELYDRFKAQNILTRKYFYPACHDYDCYKNDLSVKLADLSVVNDLKHKVLCLPFYGNLNSKTLNFICNFIKSGENTANPKTRMVAKKINPSI